MLDDVFVGVVFGAEAHTIQEPDVNVRADERRHHRLACKIDTRGAGREFDLTFATDAPDLAVLNEKAEPSIGAVVSPTINRAPSNRIAFPLCGR